MKKNTAQNLISKTKTDYEFLSREFFNTRKFPWKELVDLGEYAKDGDQVLDLGCAHGRLLEVLKSKKIDYLGLDNCSLSIKEAQARWSDYKFQIADATKLNLPQNSFDKIFMIATFHHIPGKEMRLKVLRDLNKILKPGGLLIMTNWNLKQGKYFRLWLKCNLKKLFGKNKMDWNDILVPWKHKEKTVSRYYHAFSRRELKKLLKQSNFKIQENYFVKKGWKVSGWRGWNLVTIAKK